MFETGLIILGGFTLGYLLKAKMAESLIATLKERHEVTVNALWQQRNELAEIVEAEIAYHKKEMRRREAEAAPDWEQLFAPLYTEKTK